MMGTFDITKINLADRDKLRKVRSVLLDAFNDSENDKVNEIISKVKLEILKLYPEDALKYFLSDNEVKMTNAKLEQIYLKRSITLPMESDTKASKRVL